MNIAILGCGAYATALCSLFLKNKCNITMWSVKKEELDRISCEYKVNVTQDLGLAINNCDLIVVTTPLKFLDNVMMELGKVYKDQSIILGCKGISEKTCMFASEIMKKHVNVKNFGVISGGSFAIDMINDYPVGLTLATKSKIVKEKIDKSLKSKKVLLDYNHDIIGTQICGSVKNIMAIGCGIVDGLNYPESTRSLFLTHAIYEINSMIKYFKGHKRTIYSYAGFDDIIMTCSSTKSRNYTLGYMIGSKKSKKEIEEYKNSTTVEGLHTTNSVHRLYGKNAKKFPISETIYKILYEDADVNNLIKLLQ